MLKPVKSRTFLLKTQNQLVYLSHLTRFFLILPLVYLLLLSRLSCASAKPQERRILDDYIQHFDEVHYDHHELHKRHERHKRSLDRHVILNFRALDRNFKLKLVRDNTIFAPDHVHQHINGTREDVDTSFVYKGLVFGYPGSHVSGVIIGKTFRGEITIPGDTTYHVEPSLRFFPDEKPFHSVIYSEKDLNVDPYKERREKVKESTFGNEVGSCGNDDIHAWMKSVQESVIRTPDRVKRDMPHADHANMYTEKVNKRSKRGLLGNNTCTLFLQSDPELWKYMRNTLKLNPTRAKDEILGLFANHVNAIKTIYGDTNFTTYDGSLNYVGVSFVVQRTTIMTEGTEKCGFPGASPFCSPNIDVSNFLNQNSLTSHDDFCLAYIFTYRDFNGGTLGLAWVGSPNKAAGGICEKYQSFPEGMRKVKKSLNTGILTLVNFNKRVPPKVSQLTFAHEVGHNFGSPHDKGVQCAPYGSSQVDANKGNYIMYASATSGDKVHNSMFSPCSKDNITRVLDAVVNRRNGKYNCFVSSKTAFCGNKLVEEGEECDCGYKEDCANNKCCHYRGSPGGKECKLKSNAKCSETAGPCCNGSTCDFVPVSVQRLCHRMEPEGCTYDSKCDGFQAKCPQPKFKVNMTLCNFNSKVCIDGHCIGPVCQKIYWEECFLTAPDDDLEMDREHLCYVSCRNNITGECISSKDVATVNKSVNAPFKKLLLEINKYKRVPLKLPAGSPCDNFRGYCDVFHRCRRVDAEGPLARLKNLIFNPETLQTIREWIIIHWWAVMLMCIVLVLFMAAFIKVCAVHTPSSKPSGRRPSLQPRRTMNRQPQPRHQTPPPPYPGESFQGLRPGHGRGPRYDSHGSKGPRTKGGHRDKEVEMRNYPRT